MKRCRNAKRSPLQALFAIASLLFVQSMLYGGDFLHLNLSPSVLNTASIPGTPVGIAADASGFVVVVTSEGSVLSLGTTGNVLKSISLSAGAAPVAVAIDDVGDIYIATNNGTLYRLNTGLTVLTTQTVAGTPVDIAVDNVGNVYVATNGGRIFKRNSNLAALSDNGVTGTPKAVTALSDGSVFVTTSEGTVYHLSTGLVILASGTMPGSPIDVAGDDAGNIVVAAQNGNLYKINNSITVLATINLQGPLVGVAIDAAGDVVTANQGGTVFVVNTGLSSQRSQSTGKSLSAITVNGVGDIYAVGGTGVTTVPAATFSATSLSFGNVATGTSNSKTFTVTSSGSTTLTISSASIATSAPAGVWTLQPSVPPTIDLAPSYSKLFTVGFNVPAGLVSDVAYTATITVVTNDPTKPSQAISVAGTGHVPIPHACYSATSLAFGQVNRGSSIAKTFTITNCGDANLQIQKIQLTTSSPSGVWSIVPAVPPAISLTPSTPCTFTVTFAVPASITSDVTYSATFEVTTTDPSNLVQSIAVAGTGHVPTAKIEIPPEYSVIDYRDVEIGFHFSRPLLIRNIGDLALTFQMSYADPADPDVSQFQLEASGGVITIPPNTEQVFRQTFQPTSTGNKDLVLVVGNTNDASFTSQNITLKGVGTPPIPIDVAMVLDRSGSMSESAGEVVKIQALQRAGTLFTELLRDGTDYLGITKYNQGNSNILDLGPIASVRSSAEARLSEINDPAGIKPSGTTGIGGAMRTASSQFALSPDATHKQIMIVLTDGMENEPPWISQVLDGYDSYPGLFVEHPALMTYSIGLGLASDINADKLQEISNRGAGGFYLVTGNLEGLSLFNLENFYFKIFADAIGQSIVLDPTYFVGTNQTLEVPVGIVTEDREALFFFIGELSEQAYIFELIDPHNNVVSSSSTIGGMSVQVKKLNNWIFFRVKFPPPDASTDYIGIWKFRVRISDTATSTKSSSDVMHLDSQVAGQIVAPKYRRMSFAASVASDYRLAASLQPGTVAVGDPIHMRAALTDGGWPSAKGTISVTITEPGGAIRSEQLYDDGLHGDEKAHDGIFGGTFYHTTPGGVYQFLFTAIGTTERGETVSRQVLRSQFVGAITPEPRTPPCVPCWMVRILIYLLILILIVALILLARYYRTQRA